MPTQQQATRRGLLQVTDSSDPWHHRFAQSLIRIHAAPMPLYGGPADPGELEELRRLQEHMQQIQELQQAVAASMSEDPGSEGKDDEEDEAYDDGQMLVDAQAVSDAQPSDNWEGPQPSCWLCPAGQVFTGFQRYSGDNQTQQRRQDDWLVSLRVHSCDWQRATVCGTMEARIAARPGSSTKAPIVTYWEADLIDNVNHTFFTDKWGATHATDLDHWQRFGNAFTTQMRREVVTSGGRCRGLSQHSHIFMRLKEKDFVSVRPDCGLSISGLYYLCLDRQTGALHGYYHDPHSTPYQYLELKPEMKGGMAFGSYEFA